MSRPGGRQSRSAILAPLAVALIWGVNVPVMKAGLAELDPFLFNAARLSLSALSLGLFSEPASVVHLLESYLAGLSLGQLSWRSLRWFWRRLRGRSAAN